MSVGVRLVGECAPEMGPGVSGRPGASVTESAAEAKALVANGAEKHAASADDAMPSPLTCQVPDNFALPWLLDPRACPSHLGKRPAL